MITARVFSFSQTAMHRIFVISLESDSMISTFISSSGSSTKEWLSITEIESILETRNLPIDSIEMPIDLAKFPSRTFTLKLWWNFL